MHQRSIGSDASTLRKLTASLRTASLPTWLRDAMDPAAVAEELRGRIGQVVPGALDLAGIRLQDVRVRRSWSLRFDAEVITAHGIRQVTLVAERPLPGAEPALRPGAVLIPELGLTVTAVEGDPDLPALRTLADPTAARPLLEAALRGDDRPGLRLDEVQPRLVRYKPGRRATLIYELRYPADAHPSSPRRVVAKVYRDEGGASTHAWMRALWESRLGQEGVPRLAEPLEYLVAQRTLLQHSLSGDRTVAELIADRALAGGPPLETALQGAADGLVSLHGSGVATGPPRTTDTELVSARRLLDRVGPSLPAQIRADAQALLGFLADLAGDVPQETVPVHGAFRPAQVLLDGARPGFLDFDGFGQGEPALDAGRFVARLAELVAGQDAGDDRDTRVELTRVFVDRYRAGAPLAVERMALWVALDLTAETIRSWYRARYERARLLLGLLDEVAAW